MITVTIAAFIAFYAFTFRVDPDELGRLTRLCNNAPALSSDACDLPRCFGQALISGLVA
jgi:hypothetical protein